MVRTCMHKRLLLTGPRSKTTSEPQLKQCMGAEKKLVSPLAPPERHRDGVFVDQSKTTAHWLPWAPRSPKVERTA